MNLADIPFKLAFTDNGNCRVCYTRQIEGKTRRYALIPVGSGRSGMYELCSATGGPDWWEPDTPIRPDAFRWDLLPPPEGDEATDLAVRKFLASRVTA